jgi:hypothetical protein
MENPASWGPLEKAIAEIAGRIDMGCASPAPSMEDRSLGIATDLVRGGHIRPIQAPMAARAILAALQMRQANPMPMTSEPLEIANALRAAGVVK